MLLVVTAPAPSPTRRTNTSIRDGHPALQFLASPRRVLSRQPQLLRGPDRNQPILKMRFRLLAIPVALTLLVFVTLRFPTPSIPASWSQPGWNGQAPATAPAGDPTGVDWSRFAITQYVTNSEYLCNSVMLFERLQHVGSRADRVMMYPSYMLDPAAATSDTRQSNDARLLLKARDEYNARLVPIQVQRRDSADSKFPSPPPSFRVRTKQLLT